MNILVTGGAGYLGSVLIPKLLVRGHRLRVLDIGYFGIGHLLSCRPPVDVIREDIRRLCTDKDFREKILDGIDCIVHLAAISNDPSAELHVELTDDVNVNATRALAKVARSRNIRFIFSSTCSVYGKTEAEADENSSLCPLTVYAKSKVKSEQLLEKLIDDRWSPVILRNGTLFGYSPRMRFDLVVNIFSLYSTLYNEIKIFGKGKEWRPFLHVGDCAKAIVFFVEKPTHRYCCYNVACKNLRVIDIAEIFQNINPLLKVNHITTPNEDLRNYYVTTRRIEEEGFKALVSVESGAEEMIEAIVKGVIQDPESVYYRNVKWLAELTQIGSKNHKDIVTFMESMSHIRNRWLGGK